MAKCRSCKYSFRIEEDEQDGQRNCPRCGYAGYVACSICGNGISDTQARLSSQRADDALPACKGCVSDELSQDE